MQNQWLELNHASATELAAARMEAHYAVQYLARAGRAYLPHQSDDSHTAARWDPVREELLVGPITAAETELRVAVRIKDLTLIAAEEYPLNGRSFADGLAWLQSELAAHGLNPGRLADPLHYEIPDHALASGALFSVTGNLTELARYFANGVATVEEIRLRESDASAVLCWPHHFDIGQVITLDPPGSKNARSVGVGLSLGDQSYPQPYWYVNPWPAPEIGKLPELTVGNWHTSNWVGAVLTASDFSARASAEAQRKKTAHFLENAITAAKHLLS